MHRATPRTLRQLLEWSPRKLFEQLSHPAREVFGDQPGAARDMLLRQTLNAAWEKMPQREEPDPAKWSWGKLHVVRFRHPLDQAAGAAALMNLGPLPRPGDGYTVNATWYGESFEQLGGASYREILDTSDWDRSVAVNTPGQSGQPGSPHYSDLMHMWEEGKYFPLVYSREAVENNTTARL